MMRTEDVDEREDELESVADETELEKEDNENDNDDDESSKLPTSKLGFGKNDTRDEAPRPVSTGAYAVHAVQRMADNRRP